MNDDLAMEAHTSALRQWSQEHAALTAEVERLRAALKVAAVRFDSLAHMDSRELAIKSLAEGAAADARATLE